MRTSDPHVLDSVIVRAERLCVFCRWRPVAGRGDACEHCLDLAHRAASGDNEARFALCRLAGRNVLRRELSPWEAAYAAQGAAYQAWLEHQATLSRLHPMGIGRPRKALS